MKLYLSVDTDIEDLEIDCIEVRLVSGETVAVDWDESDIARREDGFDARYKGVYFNEEYANGKLSGLRGMQIEYIDFCTESDSDSDIVITDMTFEDEGEQYTPKHLLPYVISGSEEEVDIETCCQATENDSTEDEDDWYGDDGDGEEWVRESYRDLILDCYEGIADVEEPIKKAAFEQCAKDAAERDTEAQFLLGLCYVKGIGVEQNEQTAVSLYLAAARGGNPDAQYEMGRRCESGNGVGQSLADAAAWFGKAAAQGEENAIEALQPDG